jgi:hypothetical protein
MKVIDHVVVGDDILEEEFVCNLSACLGACCKAGDAGAPLEQEEVEVLAQEFDAIKPFLEPEGVATIRDQGLHVWQDGAFKTPLRTDKHCAYSIEDEHGQLHCGIERAFEAGATSFRKPISCHLYPVRVKKSGAFEHLTYDRWDICAAACVLGRQLKVPVYKFVRNALVRKYGQAFWDKLDER